MTDYGWHKAPFGTLHHFRGIFRFMIKYALNLLDRFFASYSQCVGSSQFTSPWHTMGGTLHPLAPLFIPMTFFQVFPCWNMLQTHWIVFLQATLNVKHHPNSHHRAKLWMTVWHLLVAFVMAVVFLVSSSTKSLYTIIDSLNLVKNHDRFSLITPANWGHRSTIYQPNDPSGALYHTLLACDTQCLTHGTFWKALLNVCHFSDISLQKCPFTLESIVQT